jgi:membrane protease YdiL (CAAX protease family)
MYRFNNRIHFSNQRSSLGSAILLLLFVLAGFIVIGPLVGIVVIMPFVEGSIVDIMQLLSPPFNDPSAKTPLFIIQGFATGIGLILAPILFFKIWENQSPHELVKRPVPIGFSIVLVFFIGFCFMGVNAFFIEWNQDIQFPEFLRDFENWAQKSEQRAAEATKFLTSFDHFGHFLLAFIVIAIIPAIGEELVFRGLLQNYFHRGIGNIHLAIWISAILFSTIHVQFYGFVPRMLLGALFGYLYYWSANLWIPIIAHFFNNGFTLLMVYLYNQELTSFDIENTESAPWYSILLFAALTFLLLRYFYFYFKNYYLQHDQVEEHLQD